MELNFDSLKRELELALTHTEYVSKSIVIIEHYKGIGLTKNQATDCLNQLRTKFKSEEAIEDRILEVLDFVTGFCSPQNAVWDSAEE